MKPTKHSLIAGADTIPRIGTPSSTRATLTVNSPFLLINSLVPSKGSINQNKDLVLCCASPSSDKIGIFGSIDAREEERTS